jgi:hypothetical protein
MSLRRIIVMAVVLLSIPAAAAWGLGARHGNRVVLHPSYRVVGHDGEQTDGAYTIFWRANDRAAVGTLLDERTGQRTLVRLPRDCRHPVGSQEFLGDSWLLVDCSQRRLGLYALRAHRWRSVAVRGPCRRARSCSAIAVGSRWVEFDRSSSRRGDTFLFQNVASGVVRTDPRTSRIFPDLDSRTLARRVCPAVRVPLNGTLIFRGRFVLVDHYQDNTFLQECGTGLHEPAGGSVSDAAIGPGAVIYDGAPSQKLRGIALPNLQRFTIALPHGADDVIGVGLSLRHIYVEAETRSGRYDVWSAPASTLSKARTGLGVLSPHRQNEQLRPPD